MRELGQPYTRVHSTAQGAHRRGLGKEGVFHLLCLKMLEIDKMLLILSYTDKILNRLNLVPNQPINSVKIEYNVPNLKGPNRWQSHTKICYLRLRNPCIYLRSGTLCTILCSLSACVRGPIVQNKFIIDRKVFRVDFYV